MTKEVNQIIIRDFLCHARIGCHQAERDLGQTLELTLIVNTSFQTGFKTDSINDVICYSELVDKIQDLANDKVCNLIEHFADYILDNLFTIYPQIKSINLTVHKPYLPVKLQKFNIDIRIHRINPHY